MATKPDRRDPSARSAWRLSVLHWSFVILIPCAITYAVELVADNLLHRLNSGVLYQLLVASGPRKPTPRFTAIITLDPPTNQTGHNVCRQRALMGEVIRAVAQWKPAVIVLDKSFGRECDESEPETLILLNAVRDISTSVPIVVGREIDDSWSRRAEGDVPRLLPALKLDVADRVTEGIVNVDGDDMRRLPLGWTVIADGNHPTLYPTLSVAAASAWNPLLLTKSPKLRDLLMNNEQPSNSFLDRLKNSLLDWLKDPVYSRDNPYIPFLDSDDVKNITYSRVDLFCGDRVRRAVLDCRNSRTPEELSYLRNRIVVIGERNMKSDAHETVTGIVPGYTVQANYIEALLTGGYLRGVRHVWNWAAGALLYFVTYWIIDTFRLRLERPRARGRGRLLLRGFAIVATVLIGAVGTLYTLVLFAGLFVNPLRVGLLVIVFKLAELLVIKLPIKKLDFVSRYFKKYRQAKARPA